MHIRPTPDSAIRQFGAWISTESFNKIKEDDDPTINVEKLNKIINDKVDEHFPVKTVKKFFKDQEWMTQKLRVIRRRKAREYRRHQNSAKFRALQKEYMEEKEKQTRKYVQKEVEILRSSKPAEFFRRMKKLGAQPGEDPDDQKLSVTSHIDRNLDPKESALKL